MVAGLILERMAIQCFGIRAISKCTKTEWSLKKMRADIDKNGKLTVIAENEIEDFILKMWWSAYISEDPIFTPTICIKTKASDYENPVA